MPARARRWQSGYRQRVTYPVAIVGAGPTGLVAATLLAQYGVPSVLLERHPQAYPLPRAVHLDDEVLRILQQVGVAEQFAEVSRPAAGLRLLDARHRVIAEFRRELAAGVHGYPPSNLFDQPDLERLLRQNLDRYPQIELRSGVEVTGVEVIEDALSPVVVAFRDVVSGASGRLRAAAVLGCDGAGSVVRGFVGARLEDLGFTERWLVLDVRTALELRVWDGVEQVCDPHRAATFLRIGPQRYRWEFRLGAGETAALLTVPDRLRGLIAPWLGTALGSDGMLVVERCAEYTFRARLADRWRAGPVFLLGDAAHQTPPFIGQGLAAGLRDAHNLAWKLARTLTGQLSPASAERLLDSYQAERKPHVRALIRLAVLAGWAMTGGQDRAAVLRRAVLAAGCRVPGVTGLILDNTSPRLVAGPLVRRLSARQRWPSWRRVWPGHELAGTLCPQPWVLFGGRRRRLDDVLGLSFVVLTTGSVESESGDDELRALAARFDARVITVDDAGLARWLARSGVRAVLVRPDRIVQLSVPAGGGYGGWAVDHARHRPLLGEKL